MTTIAAMTARLDELRMAATIAKGWILVPQQRPDGDAFIFLHFRQEKQVWTVCRLLSSLCLSVPAQDEYNFRLINTNTIKMLKTTLRILPCLFLVWIPGVSGTEIYPSSPHKRPWSVKFCCISGQRSGWPLLFCVQDSNICVVRIRSDGRLLRNTLCFRCPRVCLHLALLNICALSVTLQKKDWNVCHHRILCRIHHSHSLISQQLL